MTDVGTVMTEQIVGGSTMVGGSTAKTPAYTFRGRVYTPEGTLVRHAGNGVATSPMDDGGVHIMLDVGVFCPCCAKTAENITVGGRIVTCSHVTTTSSDDPDYDPVTSGDTKAQFARRLQHFKELESKGGDGGGDLRVDVSEPMTPQEELLSFVSDLNDMFRPSEAPSPGSERPLSAGDNRSLSSPRTPDSAGRSSLTHASSISESLETSLRSINELADEWGCRGAETLRPGAPAPTRRRFPSQECMESGRPLNGHVTFSDDVRRPRTNTASAADGVEMRRVGGAAYTANRHKRFSDDVTMFCYHNEATMEPPARNAMSVSPVGTRRPGDDASGSSSDEARALDELLAELTGTSYKKPQRRSKSARDGSATGSGARPCVNGVVVGAPFEDSPDGCVTNLQRQVSGQTTSSLSYPRSTATTPPIVQSTRTNCEAGRACHPAAACNGVGPVAVRPTALSHVTAPGRRPITFDDEDENDELREIASLSRTISSGCSNDILVEVVTNALKRSVTREYSVTRSDSPEADIDMVLEHADTEIFTGDVTLRRVFSVQRERDNKCTAHARRSSRRSTSNQDGDVSNSCATCEHCGFAYGEKKRRACENEAGHGGVVVQQKWSIKNNTIHETPVTSPNAITTTTYVETRTRQENAQRVASVTSPSAITTTAYVETRPRQDNAITTVPVTSLREITTTTQVETRTRQDNAITAQRVAPMTSPSAITGTIYAENKTRSENVITAQRVAPVTSKSEINATTIVETRTRSDNAITTAPVTSPSAITTTTVVETRTRQDVIHAHRPVQDRKLERVHVESVFTQKARAPEPEPLSVRPVHERRPEPTLESAFEEALENVTDADSSFHEEDKPTETSATGTDEVELTRYDFARLTRPRPTSSCECIADDRSNRDINDVDTDTSCARSGGDVTTDDSDAEWTAEYGAGEKRGSFGQLIGDTLRMTEELLATFEQIDDEEDDVTGVETTPGDNQVAVTPRSPDRTGSQAVVEDHVRVVQVTSKVESVSASPDDHVTSVERVNGPEKTNDEDHSTGNDHEELRREMYVANTVADSEECFFPYLEVIPPSSPRLRKAPCIIEPSTPINDPPKREAIFNDLVVSRADTDSDADDVTEERSRGATPDVDRLFVQASRDVAYDSGSDVLGDLCVTTDEEPDLDALVESNTKMPTEQEARDRALEVGQAVNGSDSDRHSPNTKKKRKYVGARKRVDVTQFAQFRPVEVVERNPDVESDRVEAQDAELTNTETIITRDKNENTAQSRPAYVSERKETIIDDVSRQVEIDTTLTDNAISAEVHERDKQRDVEMSHIERRTPPETYTAQLPKSAERPEVDTERPEVDTERPEVNADDGWRTVLCEESSELADSPCQLRPSSQAPSGARYVYRASSTRGNTERFDDVKRRAGLDVDKALTASGSGDAEEKVVSEELDIKKVTLLFTLPKQLGPVLPRQRPPGSTGGKKRIHIRRVTRIKADGTVEVIQEPTVQTIRYTPAAITTTAAPSGEQKDVTPQKSVGRSSAGAEGNTLAQNARKTEPVPVEINMKYRHTKLRKYCKVAPLKRCAVEPPNVPLAVAPPSDQNGTPDVAIKETTHAQPRTADKDVGKTANTAVDQRDTRSSGNGHSVGTNSSGGSDVRVANGVETAVTETHSKAAAFPQQNGGVTKAKLPPPKVKPKPKIPSWLATQLSTDDGEEQAADVNDDKETEPAAGPVVHRETTTTPSGMRSFKETTL